MTYLLIFNKTYISTVKFSKFTSNKNNRKNLKGFFPNKSEEKCFPLNLASLF